MKTKPRFFLDFRINCDLTEIEARALEAMVGYGIDPFLKVFYEHMGQHYMKPYEAGLRSLFKTINEEVKTQPYHVDIIKRKIKDIESEKP